MWGSSKTYEEAKGRIVGTLLASIAVRMMLNKLLGGGHRRDPGLRNRTPNISAPYAPPILIGRGSKKVNEEDITIRKKHPL